MMGKGKDAREIDFAMGADGRPFARLPPRRPRTCGAGTDISSLISGETCDP